MSERTLLAKILLMTVSLLAWRAADSQAALPPKENEDGYDEGYISFLKTKAAAGDPKAEFALGSEYDEGLKVPKDPKLAASWYRKAAQKGDAAGQYYYAGKLYSGEGVAKDDKEATRLLRLSAEQDFLPAEKDVASSYADSADPDERAEAAKWWKKVADRNDPMGENNLGVDYSLGIGVAKNPGEAMKWFRKAAEQGYDAAADNLAGMYDWGEGVPRDRLEAAKWFLLAAEHGSATAENRLAGMYMLGQGVEKDPLQAYMWANLACANWKNLDPKCSVRSTAEDGMTEDEINEAQKMSKEWLLKHPMPEQPVSQPGER